jgi:hypothetical protein
MRTNVNLADDAREFADLYAYANGLTLGEAISELIRKNQRNEARESGEKKFELSPSGFPVFPLSGRRITTEMVRQVEEDDLD